MSVLLWENVLSLISNMNQKFIFVEKFMNIYNYVGSLMKLKTKI